MNLADRELPDLDNWYSVPPESKEQNENEPNLVETLNMDVEVIVEESSTKSEKPQRAAKKPKRDYLSLQTLLALAGDNLQLTVERSHSRHWLNRNRSTEKPRFGKDLRCALYSLSVRHLARVIAVKEVFAQGQARTGEDSDSRQSC